MNPVDDFRDLDDFAKYSDPANDAKARAPGRICCPWCLGSGMRPGKDGASFKCRLCRGVCTVSKAWLERRQALRATRAQNRDQWHAAWVELHPQEAAWLAAMYHRSPTPGVLFTFPFADAMREKLASTGDLSDAELATIRRCVEKRRADETPDETP